MKKFIIMAAIALGVTGCATADQRAFYKDIQGCTRTYKGSLTIGGMQLGPGIVGSADIGCDPLEITKAKAAAIKAESDAKVEAIKAGTVIASDPPATPHP